jgi:hypothetical protein
MYVHCIIFAIDLYTRHQQMLCSLLCSMIVRFVDIGGLVGHQLS